MNWDNPIPVVESDRKCAQKLVDYINSSLRRQGITVTDEKAHDTGTVVQAFAHYRQHLGLKWNTMEQLYDNEKLALVTAHCSVPRTNSEWSSDCVCSLLYGDEKVPAFLLEGLITLRRNFPGGAILTALGEEIVEEIRKELA